MIDNNYYYDIKNGFINKYKVIFDEEVLKKLKISIINECSKVSHKKHETDNFYAYMFDYNHVKNFSYYVIDSDSSNVFLTQVEYDYYEHSRLVNVIDELLRGKYKVIEMFGDDDFLKKDRNIEIDENKLKLKINKLISKGEYDRIDEVIREEELRVSGEDEVILKKEFFYLSKLKECIYLSLYDQLKIDRFEEIRDFFNDVNTSKNVSSSLKRVLKLND